MLLKFLLNSQENTILETCNFIKTETSAQVFFCEFYKIFKNMYFVDHLRTIASENRNIKSNSTVRNLLYRRAGILATLNIYNKQVMSSC